MDVFIGWSGQRSKMAASALHSWLPLVFETITPWMSSTDIDKGARWVEELSAKLEHSNVGVICVTPENIGNPWLLFESGAIAKKVSTSLVCTLVIGMQKSSIKGPLSQFQHTEPEKADMLRFVHTLNDNKPPPRRSASDIEEVFDNLWPALMADFDKILSLPSLPSKAEQSTAQQLEYYRQKATKIELKVSPRSADLFFNDRLLGSSPQTIRVNPEASGNTVSAAAANHFDSHLIITDEDLKRGEMSITLEHKLTSFSQSTRSLDRDWEKHVPRWLRDRRRYWKNPVLARAIVTYLCFIEEYDEAIAEADAAVRLAPEWYMAHNAKGYALIRKGEVSQAIEHFRITAAMKADNYLGHYNLAAAYSREKDYQQCIDNLQRILDSDNILATFSDAKQDIKEDSDFENIRNDDEFKARFADVCNKIEEAMERVRESRLGSV